MSSITQRNAGKISVGVALDGAGWHPAAWRDPAAQPERLISARYWQELAVAADAAGLTFVSIEDSLTVPSASGLQEADGAGAPRPHTDRVEARLDALMIASWVAPHTERVALFPTVTTTHTEPFHVATGLQTLDHISEGRAGWQLRVSSTAAEARAFGRREDPVINVEAARRGDADAGMTELLGEAADVAEVAHRLWTSWESDAIIRDAATGRFLDRDKVHHINFEGDRFSVVGPSIVPRSPQGQLPIALLAHTPPVIELAARVADIVFVTPASAEAGAEIVELVRETEARVNRAAAEPLHIVADLVVALDTATERGIDRLDRLTALSGSYGSDARIVAGSAEEIADVIAEWHAAGIDGVRLRPAVLPTDLTQIAEALVPALARRGLPVSDTHPRSSFPTVTPSNAQTEAAR